MLTTEFNALPLAERKTMVFADGTLINIFEDQKLQKSFFYKLKNLKVDVIYDKARNQMLDIHAWDAISERKAV